MQSLDDFIASVQCDELSPEPTFDDLRDVSVDPDGRPLEFADSLTLRDLDDDYFARLQKGEL